MKVIDLKTEYNVKEQESISLNIVIGDAQIGASIVYLEDKEIGRGEIQKLKIGLGSTIKGKKLKIKSVVTDVNDMTKQTSITYELIGGIFDQSFCSKGTVEENGDSIIYRAIFSLK